MNKIAICDDNLAMAGKLEEILLSLQQPFDDIFDIEVFSSGKELINNLDGGSFYDIAFLDIEMGDTSGIDVGHHIRRVHENQNTVIIYVSAYDNYHTKLYPVKTTAFIRKPPTTEDVREALVLAVEQLDAQKSEFIYQYDGRIRKVPKSDIFYFESDGHYITVVTRLFSDFFRMHIDELVERIDDPVFVKTHRSYVANLRNVTTYSQKELFFPNEQSVPIGRRRIEDVKRALLKHIK